MKKYTKIIGIDTGVNTGVALWSTEYKNFGAVFSTKIHSAIETVKQWTEGREPDFLVRVEDARLRKWYGSSGREKLQGAGSVKRDAKIWEDFLKDLGVDYELVPPKKNKTKLTSKQFQRLTGWPQQTNEHSRDAGMLVFNY